MNFMNLVNDAERVPGCQKKNNEISLFFYFWLVWNVVLGSFSFMKFINSTYLDVFSAVTLYFMNYMKIYEVRGFMAIFENAVLIGGEKMKKEFCPASLKFIF